MAVANHSQSMKMTPAQSNSNYLQLALQQAYLGRGSCAPNPAVGAVIVKDQQILASGYHQQAGLPHAEIAAMDKLSAAELQGADLYVTLEPCNHRGKTPACTEAIVKNQIKRVFYGYHDPNPNVAGSGAETLRQHGIDCQHISAEQINQFYQSYHYWLHSHLPFVTVKLAMSLDGKVAGPHGQPVQITHSSINHFTQQQRQFTDAILTTANTVNRDNPQLTARINNETQKKLIYILDKNAKLNQQAQIFNTAKQIVIFHDSDNYSEANTLNQAQLVRIQSSANQLNLTEILTFIGQQGIHDVWVEAGPNLFRSLHQGHYVNRSYVYIAGKFLGETALSAFANDFQLDLKNAKINWRSYAQDACCQIDWEN